MKGCVLCCILFAMFLSAKAQTEETMADKSFGVKGDIVITDANRSIDTSLNLSGRMALQGSKIIFAGGITGEGSPVKVYDKLKLFRLNSNGSLDSSFGDKGVFSYAFPEKWNEGFYRVRCQSDGKIVCLTYAYNGNFSNYKSYHGLLRVNANGSLDTSFGTGGFYATGDGGRDMVILPNDEIVVVSKRGIEGKLGYKIIKYGKDGGIIASDSIQFISPYYISSFSEVVIRVTNNNKIVVGGDQYYRGPKNLGFTVFRYDFSLKRDMSYGREGHFTYVVTKTNGYNTGYSFVGMATQSNGKVVGAYLSNDTLKMIGVDNTGKLNKNFGVNGINNYKYRIRLHYIDNYTGIESQSDDKILFAPLLNARGIYLTRFKADGYIDPSFGDSGYSFKHVFVRGHKARTTPFEILVQPDDKILVNSVGEFTEFNDHDFEGAAVISRYLSEKESDKTVAKSITASSFKTNRTNISVSPNPVKDILNIYSSNLSYKNVSIISSSGIVILKDAFAGKQHSINVSNLSSAIYNVTAVDKDGNITSTKMVKQ